MHFAKLKKLSKKAFEHFVISALCDNKREFLYFFNHFMIGLNAVSDGEMPFDVTVI